MSTPPYWALSLIYWLHMLATVTWIGALASLSLVVLPAARQLGDANAYAHLMTGIQKRMEPLGWISLLVLVGTGMFQMSASANYAGFMAITNRWAAAILIKHLVFFGMTGVSAYITWGLLPALSRAAMRQAHGMDAPEANTLHRREAAMIRLNLALGVIVLGLTALARAS